MFLDEFLDIYVYTARDSKLVLATPFRKNDAFAGTPVPAAASPGSNGGRFLAISQFLNHSRYRGISCSSISQSIAVNTTKILEYADSRR